MNRTIIMLLVSLGVAFGPAVSEALAAASQRKKMVIAAGKKPVKSVVKRKSHGHHARNVAAVDAGDLMLRSASVLVQDQTTGAILFEKNADAVVPIASLTKLMTAMVALDAGLPLDEKLDIGKDDVDILKGTHSRLRVGTFLSREEMLRLALMSSENRAAAALSRHYPGGREAFVAAMNQKAQILGLTETRFSDSTGLTAANVSSARDLTRLVDAAHHYPLIREFSTTADYKVAVAGRPQTFRNTNSLVKSSAWEIGLSKTGYISEAGKCLVMQAWLNNKPMIIVLLDSWGRLTRIGDANRIKRWVESAALPQLQTAG